MIRTRSVPAGAFLACVLATSAAFAQPSDDSTLDVARKLYVEGKDLREAGDLERSLEKLEAAHALYATPITALEVARGRALVGKLRGAIDVLDSIEHLPLKSSESAKAASARTEAQALLVQYRARIPKLVFRLDGPDTRVWVDGEVVPNDALSSAYSVNPGVHHVAWEGARGERAIEEDVGVAEGEQREVVLRLNPASRPAPSAATGEGPPRRPVEATPPASGSPNVIAYVAFGVGAAGVALGTVTGLLTLLKANDIRPQCSGGICPASSGLESAQTLGTVSTISFVVGGVGAAAGVAAVLLSRRHEDRPRSARPAGVWAGPSIAGAVVGVRGGF